MNRSLIKNLTVFFGVFAAFTILFAAPTNAQFRAAIQGVVADSNGATVSGATVTLTNNETGRTQQTSSSENGFYRFSSLAPGSYSITVEQANFKKQVIENLQLAAENTQGVDIVLSAGNISESVTVTDEAAVLETENADVQRGISTTEIRNLPQQGRDPYELLRLTPGVLGAGARGGNGGAIELPNTPEAPGGSDNSIFQTENQVPISAAGQRVSSNNFQIDGVSVNSLQYGGAAVITPNQESVKEVQISSSSFNAEDGRNSGAQIKVVSQNGTNEFHGSALFKYNDPGWNAFNKFYGNSARPATPRRVEQRYKTFGGSLGGPIVRDNLFFFFSYEGLRNNSANTREGWVETEQFRQAVAAQRSGGKTARILSDSASVPRLAGTLVRDCLIFFGNPTDAANNCRQVAGGLDLGSITGALGTPVGITGGGFDGIPDVQYANIIELRRSQGNQFNFRVDFNRTSDQFAFSTYITRLTEQASDLSSGSRPVSDTRNKPLNYLLTGTWNHTFSQTTINEFRANFTQFKQDQITASSETNYGYPRIEIEGPGFNNIGRVKYNAPWGDTSPALFNQKTLEFRDTLTTVIGNHAIKFGGEYRREISDNDLSGGARPLYTFVGLFNYANDVAIFELRDIDLNTGGRANAKRFFRSSNYGFFAQDNWKTLPNLTLNFGLRYEYFSPVREKNNLLSALSLGLGGRTLLDARLENVETLTDSDRNNFAPRVGFAYSPNFFKSIENKAVIRGGFGIYYNRIPNVLLSNTRLNPPFFARIGVCCGSGAGVNYQLGSSNSPFSYPVNPGIGIGVNPQTGGPLNGNAEVWGSERDLPNSEVYKYSLDIQYELPYQILASAGYEGNQSRNLVRIVNLNIFEQPRLNPGFAPVFYLRPDINGNYNGLNVRAERRFANNFQLAANYRFSKSIDTLSGEGPCACNNQTYPLDLSLERGPSDYDVRHNFNLTGLVTLPFFNERKDWVGKLLGGWELNGILTRHTGFPWTPLLGAGLRTPTGEFFGPIRPTVNFGRQPNGNSDNNFLRPGGIFQGGGGQYYGTTPPVNNDYRANPPAVGRNSLRGPKYFGVDASLAKNFGLPGFGVLGESPNLEIRFNAFNIFNNLNLAPFNFGNGNTFVGNANFGEATEGLSGRVVEFQARFRF